MRLTEIKVFLKLKAKAQAQADTPNKDAGAQRREHPGGVKVYVTTYASFNHYTVFIQMFVVTIPCEFLN